MTLTILFLIIATILLYIGCKKEKNEYSIPGIIVALICLFCTIGWIASYYNFKIYTHEYEVTKVMVESYKGQDYGNMTDLTKAVVYINDKIATHKALSNSILLKGFYSEEVGNLEPIAFNIRE